MYSEQNMYCWPFIFSYDRSVVLEAVEAKRFDVIDLLMASGAYLVIQPKKLADKLNRLVDHTHIKRSYLCVKTLDVGSLS